jgi:hypothetical protein
MHAPSDCLSLPNIKQLTKSGENFRRSVGENCIGFVYNFENIVKRETPKMEQPSVMVLSGSPCDEQPYVNDTLR